MALQRSSEPMFLRNAFAAQARGARASSFKDRRCPRGGSQNLARQWLDELDDEREPVSIRAVGPESAC